MVFLFHKPAAGERCSVSLMHLNGAKQPAGWQKSSACLCKTQVHTSLNQGEKKETRKGSSCSWASRAQKTPSWAVCILLISLVCFQSTPSFTDELPESMHNVPAMETCWKENGGLQIRSAQILAIGTQLRTQSTVPDTHKMIVSCLWTRFCLDVPLIFCMT